MPAALGISILMPSIAALWKRAAECKCFPVVRIIVALWFVGFFPTGTQKVEQERELLQHHLKGKGKRQLGQKCSFSPFQQKEEERNPLCVCSFSLP